MGKTSYKGLRVNYQPRQKVKVMLGRDWFDAVVVKANKKTVIVNTLFSRTKYRKVKLDPTEADMLVESRTPNGLPRTVLEPYTVSGTRIVKLPRVRVKPIADALESPDVSKMVGEQLEVTVTEPESPATPAPQETVEEVSVPSEVRLGTDIHEMMDVENATTDSEEKVRKFIEAGPDELTMAIEQAEAMLEERTDQITEDSIDEPKAETKPETAADVLAELEKMLE